IEFYASKILISLRRLELSCLYLIQIAEEHGLKGNKIKDLLRQALKETPFETEDVLTALLGE
ncbi:hypothetical protein, partial [Candidatus Similichlamydia laticola]|uniref:hypothetical protein n=1 Tax=Candidatus Similichlamydia laticola TaxID=2170265 RepID=UPI001C69ACA8